MPFTCCWYLHAHQVQAWTRRGMFGVDRSVLTGVYAHVRKLAVGPAAAVAQSALQLRAHMQDSAATHAGSRQRGVMGFNRAGSWGDSLYAGSVLEECLQHLCCCQRGARDLDGRCQSLKGAQGLVNACTPTRRPGVSTQDGVCAGVGQRCCCGPCGLCLSRPCRPPMCRSSARALLASSFPCRSNSRAAQGMPSRALH